AKTIRELKNSFEKVEVGDKDRVFNTELVSVLELDFMLEVAAAVVYSALNRQETRGAHCRTDFEGRDDEKFLAHTLIHRTEVEPKVELLPVTITRWKPEKRVY
ncbi:MAG: hypothetical protein LN412_05510, partial [Candidatus Thermoplasmatota archaeon]|nr:hypothetical protein [Candidatus Thermoplasmatota archaeon]